MANGLNGALTGYKVFYKTTVESSYTPVTVNPGKTNHTIVGLQKYTAYSVKMLVDNDRGDGPVSNEKTVTTKEDGENTSHTCNALLYMYIGNQIKWAGACVYVL